MASTPMPLEVSNETDPFLGKSSRRETNNGVDDDVGDRAALSKNEALKLLLETERPSEMLLGRRLARFFAKLIPGYGKNANIDYGWAYFEYVTLPRRKSDGKGGYMKAPPGSINSDLYNPWATNPRELKDFGTGVAVYFETLLALVVICLIAGIMYTPVILYYRSDDYAPMGQDELSGALRGSMICPNTEWVPCPNCQVSDWDDDLERIAHTKDGLTFALKNNCAELRWQEGLNHIAVVIFLILAMFGLGLHQRNLERKYDEDVLTASDYSIKVDNPPPDATDPEEWREFFSRFGAKVVYVTVALNNEHLVGALVKRRVAFQKVAHKITGHQGVFDESIDHIPDEYAKKHPKDVEKIEKMEEKCRSMIKDKYDTSAIFVTFETEKGQRDVLSALTVSKIDLVQNDTSVLSSNHLFRGNLVLDVAEATEPSSIRWQDLDESFNVKMTQRAISGGLTLLILAGGMLIIYNALQNDVHSAAYLIAIANILGPHIFKQVNRIESHPDEGSYQASLYVKVCMFRWINTAIMTTIVTPFTSTITAAQGLIIAVHAVLKAEIVTQPVVHMCDIVGTIKRHIFAPQGANQAAVLANFRGAKQSLGEKYTNATKVVFLCFFYSAIFPASFYFGAVALFLIFVTDKFLLMRSWAPIPELGDDVAKFSRRIFFPLTLVALAIMSEFYYSAYPFDDLCDSGDRVETGSLYTGTHILYPDSGDEAVTITLQGDGTEPIWYFCDMDFLEHVTRLLHLLRRNKDDWMGDDQEALVFAFGMIALVVVGIMTLFIFWESIFPSLKGAVKGGYSTDEFDSGKIFSDLELISAYVPQIHHPKFRFPLIACDISSMNRRNIGWVDPLREHGFYSMKQDVKVLAGGAEPDHPVLSIVSCYPSESSGAGANGSAAHSSYGSVSEAPSQ